MGGDQDLLRKYLAWSGFTCLEELPLGEPKSTSQDVNKKQWVRYLELLLESLDEATCKSRNHNPEQKDQNPEKFFKSCKITQIIYEDLKEEQLNQGAGVHCHACSIAIEMLRQTCSIEELNILSKEAYLDLVKHLWAMQHQFCVQVFKRTQALHQKLNRRGEEKGNHFEFWLIAEEGYKSLLREHSSLARIIAQGIELWVNDTSRLLKRIKKDKKELANIADIDSDTKIIQIEDGLSDPHDGKQFVKRLRFDNGSGIIYKPRNISLLKKFSEFLKQLQEENIQITLRIPACISKRNYGWVELIQQKECNTRKEVESYYNHCGQLIAILYLTRTNDIHHENVIASGEFPVIVDTDTIFYPGFTDLFMPSQSTGESHIELAVEESVLSSGLLPLWDNVNGELKDSSGMSCLNEQSANTVIWEGKIQSAHVYADQVVQGFHMAAQNILKNQNKFKILIESFKGCRTRAIYRPTRIYEQLRQNLLSPKYLLDGITRSNGLEYLKTSLLKEDEKPQAWALVNEEEEMLFNDDIPMFIINCGDDFLKLSNGNVLRFKCGLEIAKSRLYRFSIKFIEYQAELIKASCYFTSAAEEKRKTELNRDDNNTSTLSNHCTEKEQSELFKLEADLLIDRLLGRAHYSPSYGSSWIGINILEEYGKMQLSSTGLSLYNGNTGIALTLAIRSRCSSWDNARKESLDKVINGALQPVQHLSRNSIQIGSVIDTSGLGAMTGLGSLIFACTACAKIPGLSQLLDAGEALTRAVTPELIAKESCADVMSGLAGLLIAIIELEKQTNQRSLRNLSILIGDQICSLLRDAGNNYYAWPSKNGKMLLGISHGAAGIAMALYRLYGQSGFQRFKRAALQGIDYENSKCDQKSGHWMDLRGQHPSIMNSWCNGAPGIGIARVEMHKIDPDPKLLEDIEKAAVLAINNHPTGLDQLCCGTLGRCDLLMSAGIELQRREWISSSRNLAERTIKLSRNNNGFKLLQSLPNGLSMPGFMQGEAGIAYQLLRLNQPTTIPSILALKTQ